MRAYIVHHLDGPILHNGKQEPSLNNKPTMHRPERRVGVGP